jgi:hypothetical protein
MGGTLRGAPPVEPHYSPSETRARDAIDHDHDRDVNASTSSTPSPEAVRLVVNVVQRRCTHRRRVGLDQRRRLSRPPPSWAEVATIRRCVPVCCAARG